MNSVDIPSVLREIVAYKVDVVAARKQQCSPAGLQIKSESAGAPRGFTDALATKADNGRPAVIAEVKKASPSAGIIRADFDPAAIAEQYQRGGATCLSVLTDEHYFKGHDHYLQQARKACSLPVLRKDFTIDSYQITEARVLGADAILLIAAVLDDAQLYDFSQQAQALGMDVLLEVHNETELERALRTDNRLIGINNRDLHRFVTDLSTSERLLNQMPADRIVVSESGIHTVDDIQRLRSAGIHTFLIGEAFMREPDPGKALSCLIGE